MADTFGYTVSIKISTVKFGISATNLATKGESIEFSTLIAILPYIKIKAFHKSFNLCGFMNFKVANIKRNCYIIDGTVLDGQGKHPWKAEVNEDDAGVLPATITAWYTKVYEPTFTVNGGAK